MQIFAYNVKGYCFMLFLCVIKLWKSFLTHNIMHVTSPPPQNIRRVKRSARCTALCANLIHYLIIYPYSTNNQSLSRPDSKPDPSSFTLFPSPHHRSNFYSPRLLISPQSTLNVYGNLMNFVDCSLHNNYCNYHLKKMRSIEAIRQNSG